MFYIHVELCSLCVYRLRDEIKRRRTVYESLQGTLLDICYFFYEYYTQRFKGARKKIYKFLKEQHSERVAMKKKYT